MKKAADEQNFASFPDVREGDTGTLVNLSFDRNNADATFFTPNTVSADGLLATVKTIAQDMDLPQSDFITVDTKRLRYVDLEMNDYLQKVSRSATRFDFDLSQFRAALEKTDLPRPIVLIIEPNSDTVALTEGTTSHSLTNKTFLRVEDIKPSSHLRWQALISWKMWMGATFFGGMFLLPATMPWFAARARRKQRAKEREQGIVATSSPDPAKVQEAYDKQKPQWVQQLLMALPCLLTVVPLLLLKGDGIKPFMEGISLLMPSSSFFMAMPLLMLVLFAASSLLCFGLEKWRERREKVTGAAPPPDPDGEHKTPHWLTMLPLLPMGLVFFFLPLMQIPAATRGLSAALSHFDQSARFTVIMALLMVPSFGGMLLLSWLVRKKTRQDLKPGDYWYDQVQIMAQEAGVRVRHIAITKSPLRNASATVLGTVTVTSKMLADLEPDEVRAIIAHEIGHHKASHPLRGLLLSLLVTSILMGAWIGGRAWIEQHFTLSNEVKALLRMPIFVIFVLPILRSLLTGKANRQHEFDADRFAVRVTGDPELVIRALRKIHTLDAQPHLLKKSDELLQEHPSLANRIDAIRRDAETTGMASNSDL